MKSVKYCTLCGEEGHTARYCERLPKKQQSLSYRIRCPYCNTLNSEDQDYCEKCKRSLDEVK
jgi:hypothetical protein